MADETRQVIIDVEIEGKDFDQEIGKVNSQLKQNREEIKELSKDYENNAKSIAKLETENKDLAKSKQVLIKESKTESNSINALRLKVAELTKERNNLDISTDEGIDRLDALNKELLENVNTLKKAEEAGGDFRRSVGNYGRGLKDAVGETKIFGTSLNGIGEIIKKNPLLLLAGVLAGLVRAFSKTQAGMEFFQKAGAVLNTIFGKFSDIVEALGVKLIGAFENPQKAIKDLVNTIKEGIVRYFTEFIPNAIQTTLDGFGLLGKAAKQVFSGDFAGAAETAREGIVKLADGLTDLNPGTAIIKALAKEVIVLAKETNIVAQAAFKLESQFIANEKALADLQVSFAKSIKSQKELNLIIEDTTRSEEERIAAAEEFKRVEAEQIAESIRLQEERLRILKEQNDLTNSTEEDIQRVRDAEIELANLQAASFERQVTNQNKINTIKAAAAAKSQKIIQDELKATEKAAIDAKNIKEKAAFEDAQREVALAEFKRKTEKDLFSSVVQLAGQGTKLGKTIALTQVAIDTGRAISSLTAASQANPANAFTFGGAGIAQFAAGLSIILTNIAQAKNIINSGSGSPSGGGGLSGFSSANSSSFSSFGDDARRTQSINDGVSFAISNLPPSQVAVVDINTAQNNRAVKVNESSL